MAERHPSSPPPIAQSLQKNIHAHPCAPMKTARIAIVGTRLSGLYATYLLEQHGITDDVLLEARNTLGGRIASAPGTDQLVSHPVTATDKLNCVDLGPTWFWPDYQHALGHLVSALGLQRFAQFEEGNTVVERSPHEAPTRMRGTVNSPTSMRLVGGMGALIDALHRRLDASRIVTGQAVRRLRKAGQHVELESEAVPGDQGHITVTVRAHHVLLARPPRLVEHSIEFVPTLPPALSGVRD